MLSNIPFASGCFFPRNFTQAIKNIDANSVHFLANLLAWMLLLSRRF